MDKRETFTVNAVLSFPYLFSKDDNDKYSCQLANLSPAAVAKMEELGVPVKFKDDDKFNRGQFVNTTSGYPYKVFDVDTKESMADMNIGYGTKVRAVCSPRTWNHKSGKSGVSCDVIKLYVTELVEFEGADGGEVPSEEDAL